VTLFRQSFRKLALRNWKWFWIALAGVPAIRLYYVQEMIAALIIFSVLFVGVFSVVLVIFLVDRASEQIAAWVEAGVTRLLHLVFDGVGSINASPTWAQAVPHRFRRDKQENQRS